MGKVYESQVDPDEFIRSFREEPSQLSALKRKEGTTVTTAEPATEALQTMTTDVRLPPRWTRRLNI